MIATKTLATLDELNALTLKDFSKLEALVFALPNGDFVNDNATKVVNGIIKDRTVDCTKKVDTVKIALMCFPFLIFPPLYLMLSLGSIGELLNIPEIKKSAYERFSKLREGINRAYQASAGGPYRGACPRLEAVE